jgi:16S rRNA (guanine527-N7)-methyltransferase
LDTKERLDYFANLLLKWNKVHSLTRAKDISKVNEYIEDSLYPLEFLDDFKSCLDIGTGAGFPGLVLAIAKPEAEFVLTEPLNKKASFLNIVKCELSLDNVTVYQSRVEDTPKRVYDIITSRAVTDTKMLLSLTNEYKDDATRYLFYKGEKVFDEVEGLDSNVEIIQKKMRNYLLIKGSK